MSRVLLYDIEASNLSGSMGYVFSIAYAIIDTDKLHKNWKKMKRGKGLPKIHLISVLNTKGGYDLKKINGRGLISDKEVIKKFAEVVTNEADLICGHYAICFDHKMINARAMRYGVKPMPNVKQYDTWLSARKNHKLHSNRADAITEFLGGTEKTRLKPERWVKASMGHIPSIKYIEHHNIKDIVDLVKMFVNLAPYDPKFPATQVFRGKCPVCGCDKFKKMRFLSSSRETYKSHQCSNCGKWVKGNRVESFVHKM